MESAVQLWSVLKLGKANRIDTNGNIFQTWGVQVRARRGVSAICWLRQSSQRLAVGEVSQLHPQHLMKGSFMPEGGSGHCKQHPSVSLGAAASDVQPCVLHSLES
jgi:hypothetical protein